MQSQPRALQKQLIPTRDAFTLASPLHCALTKKYPSKPFQMRTCKIVGLKVSWNEQLQKSRGGSPSSLPSTLASLSSALNFPFNTNIGQGTERRVVDWPTGKL